MINTTQRDGKTYAKLADIHLWAKNPKTVKSENMEKLKQQILTLGIYKPLIIAKDTGDILGGNQRYKALLELNEEKLLPDDEIWVSIVDAWSDELKLKYALSDNLQIGEYSQSDLFELIKPLAGQGSLFSEYNIELPNTVSVKEFMDSFAKDVDELKRKNLSHQLKEAGINGETIDIVLQMSQYNREDNVVENVEIQGKQSKKRFCIPFWFDSEEDYNVIFQAYSVNGTQKMDSELLKKKTLV